MSPTKRSGNGSGAADPSRLTDAEAFLARRPDQITEPSTPKVLQEVHRAELQAAVDAVARATQVLQDAQTMLEYRKMQVRQFYAMGNEDSVDLITGNITRVRKPS